MACVACCAPADGEVDALALSKAIMEESPKEERGDPQEAMQIKIKQLLAKGPVAFRPDEATLTPEGDRIVGELAELLEPFPEMSAKVATFASFEGNSKEAFSVKKLTLLRSRAVRAALKGAGCENKLAAEGMGHVDEKGARCEVTIIDTAEVQRVESKAAEWELQEERRSRAQEAANLAVEVAQEAEKQQQQQELCLDVVFADASGSETAVRFSKKPIGLGFKNKTPVVINSVSGHAKDCGVKKGWQVKSINGVMLRDKVFPEVLAFLREQSLALQDPEVAASRLGNLSSFEILFVTPSGQKQSVSVTKKPLDLAYKNKMPLAVTRAEGHANELGIQVGWELQAINGESLGGKEHYEATWLLQVCLHRLQN
mmetsp:Transcript_27720/g.61151  ORF Transcript_27720/g.61151 Transcript_27720/m.61151 type:complete len:371 (-) Transcript_27720:25-1137(-)